MITDALSPGRRGFTRTLWCLVPRRNRAPQSSDRARCCTGVRPERDRDEWTSDQPYDPPDVKFDIEYMTNVTVFKLGNELAGVEVPDLDGLVITCAHEPANDWVERESTNE